MPRSDDYLEQHKRSVTLPLWRAIEEAYAIGYLDADNGREPMVRQEVLDKINKATS